MCRDKTAAIRDAQKTFGIYNMKLQHICQQKCYMVTTAFTQDAQLSQRDRAAGYISIGRKWKTGTQRQYFTDIVSLASTTVT